MNLLSFCFSSSDEELIKSLKNPYLTSNIDIQEIRGYCYDDESTIV